jgi:hypothetical protein
VSGHGSALYTALLPYLTPSARTAAESRDVLVRACESAVRQLDGSHPVAAVTRTLFDRARPLVRPSHYRAALDVIDRGLAEMQAALAQTAAVPDEARCRARNRKGAPCGRRAAPGSAHCTLHAPRPDTRPERPRVDV